MSETNSRETSEALSKIGARDRSHQDDNPLIPDRLRNRLET
jgi:hypothetical protein